ncbi:MAG: hypothetical protein IJ509_03915 [Bacilli bacterium]|nr:hypothetical protein [Bacilli bacterium]
MEIINDKIKKLKKDVKILEQEIEKETNMIKTYATYDTKLITSIMFNLIYTFEGNEIGIKRSINPITDKLIITIGNISTPLLYEDISFSMSDNFTDDEGQHLTLLVPDKYLAKKETLIDEKLPKRVHQLIRNKNLANWHLIIPDGMNKEDVSYVEDFIDKLFEYRMENKLVNITEAQLKKFLKKYFYENQKKITARNFRKMQYAIQEKEKYKIKKYQETCMIERKPFIDLVINLINDSDTMYIAKNLLRVAYSLHAEKNYNKFNITNNGNIICTYESLYSVGIISDLDITKDEDNMDKFINFYDFVSAIEIVIKEIPTLRLLLDELETIYKEKNMIYKEDIDNVYKYITSNNKGYTLTKKDTSKS